MSSTEESIVLLRGLFEVKKSADGAGKQRQKKSAEVLDTEDSVKDASESSAGAAIGGVSTPLGTDASGGKGGPGKRKGMKKGQSILDKNAKSQGKYFAGAKRVNEASTYVALGRYLYADVEFNDYDLDGDGDGDIDTKSTFRGGGGNLKLNADITGKSFANAKPPTISMHESIELLNELLPPTRGITRQKPSIMAAINGFHPQILDETHVRLVLGMKPLPLNEGHVNEAHFRAILHAQLLYEGWWDSTKRLVGKGIDKIKDKADDLSDTVKAFGNNTKGVIAALWAATKDGTLVEKLTNAARSIYSKSVTMHIIKPLRKIADFFKDVSTKPKEIVDKIASGFQKFKEGLTATGWMGMLTSMAAYLGLRWVIETFNEKIQEIVGATLEGTAKASLEFAKKIGDMMTNGLISKIQEKLATMLAGLSGAALEQIAGPLAWIKKIAEIVGGVDWVTKNLIGIINRGTFKFS